MMQKSFVLLGAALCLALAVCTLAVDNSADRFFLEGMREDEVAYSGYIQTNETHDGNLFYWFFESRNDPANDPVVLWMTGGPGCSSELAVVFENGPYNYDSKSKGLVYNPHSWNNNASVIYIDQPYKTGFSYSNDLYINTEAEVAVEMYTFLNGFFQKYSQFAKNEFYITGESYGGHYVPSVSAYLVSHGNNINFQGMAIGNGWVSPRIQYGAYGPFAKENNLIGDSTLGKMNSTYEKCNKYLSNSEWTLGGIVCSELMEDVLKEAGNINIYNIKLPCVGSLCYDFSGETNYFNDPDVQSKLHVKQGVTWETCNDEVNGKFSPVDENESFRFHVPEVLAAGKRVLIYNGMLDLICNYVGGDMWTKSMDWAHSDEFSKLNYSDWNNANGDVAGHVKSVDNLTFLAVEGAGHMVPHDQPENAYEMIQNFLTGHPF